MKTRPVHRFVPLVISALVFAAGKLAHAALVSIPGPAGSGAFGTSVTVLSNGNFVVTDPNYSIPGGAANVGAVYLYDGLTRALISMLTGSTANDRIGSNVTALTNGNYVVVSTLWDNGSSTDAGAVTWCSGTVGVTGAVSTANSLVGSKANDMVGQGSVWPLANGNYVVLSPYWDNDSAADAGAVTCGSGSGGTVGAVSAANSLVGSTASDQVGNGGATVLVNGNYVVCSPCWDNGAVADVGAATWGSGTLGGTGAVSAANSLVGSTANDQVGCGATALANGNYVVRSTSWGNGAVADVGSVSLGDGTSGTTGAVTSVNSVLGDVGGGGISMVFAYDTVNNCLVVGYPSGNRVILFDYKLEVTVRSDHGTSVPAPGTHTYANGTVLTNTMSSPDTQGATQYVCTGWSMAGNEPANGTTTQCVMTVTNDAVLTWLWATNYWLATSAGPHGSVNVGSGWQALGVTTQITAHAELYYHFTNWTGGAPSAVNPLDLLIDAPKSLTANFAADMTVNHPTPHWWLAHYGLTGDFEQTVLDDSDGDGHFAWQEYVADTVPTNPASILAIASLEPVLGTSGEVTGHALTWPGAEGRVYDVECRTNLVGGDWACLLGASNFPGSCPANTVTDAPPVGTMFYRVKVRLP